MQRHHGQVANRRDRAFVLPARQKFNGQVERGGHAFEHRLDGFVVAWFDPVGGQHAVAQGDQGLVGQGGFLAGAQPGHGSREGCLASEAFDHGRGQAQMDVGRVRLARVLGRGLVDSHRRRVDLLVHRERFREVDEAEIRHASRTPAESGFFHLGIAFGAHAHQQPAHHHGRIAIQAVHQMLCHLPLLGITPNVDGEKAVRAVPQHPGRLVGLFL